MKTERQESIGDKCSICHEKVYLLERHIENSKLYHRSCFRKSDLSPTTKVFKRQPYSPLTEGKSDIHGTKQRKLDSDTAKKEPQEAGLDFWQRRAQQRANQNEKNKTTATPVVVKTETNPETKSTEHAIVADVPIWKRGLEKDNGLNSGADKDKPRSSLVDRFKELDQRNLKNLNNSEKVGGTEKSKERDKDVSYTKKMSNFEKTSDIKPAAQSPIPKPRQNVLNKVEKMETDTIESHEPKPVPRFQKKSENLSPKAAPRNIEQKSKSPQIRKKTPPITKKQDFTRPKTPPNKHKTELSLNLTKNVSKSESVHKDDAPSSPPPLPVSSPPRLPKSQCPDLSTSKQSESRMDTSPASSPRTTDKSANVGLKDKNMIKLHAPPAKPPRSAVSEDKSRSPSPSAKTATSKVISESKGSSSSDTNEMHAAPKAAIKGPKIEYNATLVVPKRQQDEKKSREVFGGLLKSLADVRQKHDLDTDNKAKLNGAFSDKENKSKLEINGAVDKSEHGLSHKFDKLNEQGKSDFKNKRTPQRPKSSFVSQNTSLFNAEKQKEPNMKVNVTTKKTTTTTTVVTYNKTDKSKGDMSETETTVTKVEDSVPDWKRQLEQRKKDKARPKSADILSEKSNVGNVPLWQIEAEKRKEARKGGYVDPEKVKIGQNRNNAAIDLPRPFSPPEEKKDVPDKFVSPIPEEKIELPNRRKIEFRGDKFNENQKPVEGTKKKITVDFKFKFDDVEMKPTPKKPPRPAAQPTSPTSPKPGPARPPPPKTGGVSVFV